MKRLLSFALACLICQSASAGSLSVTQDLTGEYVFCELCPSPTRKVLDLQEARPAVQVVAAEAPRIVPATVPATLRARVLFRLNSAVLLPEARVNLDKLLPQAASASEIIITGHTDKGGKRSRNLHLASARAAAVKVYLSKKGLPSEKIKIGSACCIDHPPLWNPVARRADIEIKQ